MPVSLNTLISLAMIAVPFTVATIGYIVRIEKKLTSISSDLEWIKKETLKCRQH